MSEPRADMMRKEILGLLEETFEIHHGAYLDKGTSLFETLAALDSAEASRTHPGMPETIAGHVYHLKFYMAVLQEYIAGTRTGKLDWSQSWIVTAVSPAAWEDLRRDLASEYRGLVGFIKADRDWDDEDTFGGTLGILMHCAYHLGAIRQLKDL